MSKSVRIALSLSGLALLLWFGLSVIRNMSDGVERIAFLDDLDLKDGTFALFLHSPATGAAPKAVLDQAMIGAAQGKAYYTVRDGDRQALQSVPALLLSPPGRPPDNGLVSVIRNGQVIRTHMCYSQECFDDDGDKLFGLAGLGNAALPVEFVTETFEHHEKASAALFRILQLDNTVFAYPPDLPAPNTIVFPRRVVLDLPSQVLAIDETGKTPPDPFDQAEFTARFTAAFAHAFPETEAYRLGRLQISTLSPPSTGWPLEDVTTGKSTKDAKGMPIGLNRLQVIAPRIAIEMTERMAVRLLAPEAFDAMPNFSRIPEGFASRLDALVEDRTGAPCKGCYRIKLPVRSVDDIRVRETEPRRFTLHYYRTVPE